MPAPRVQPSLLRRTVAAFSILATAALLYFFAPAKYSFYPQCPFHAITGLNCPGCGSLRAMHQLLHGNFQQALVLNPLAICLLPAFGFFAVRPIRNSELRENKKWLWILGIGVVVFTVLRNLTNF